MAKKMEKVKFIIGIIIMKVNIIMTKNMAKEKNIIIMVI